MAVEDSKVKSQDQTGDQPQQQSLGGGQGSSISPALTNAAATGMTAPQAKPASSGQFTNVSSYLNANKNAGQKMANVVGNQVSNNLNQAQNTVQSQGNDVANQINAEKQRLSNANQYYKPVAPTAGSNQTAYTLAQDPTQIAGQSLQNFQNLYNNQNTSQSQQDLLNNQAANAQQTLNGAQQKVNALGTESGRAQALATTLGRPSYTQGQQTLDQLLFQVGGANQLAQQQKQFGGQLSNLNNQQNQQIQDLTGVLGANKASEQNVSDILHKAVSGDTTNLQNTESQNAIAQNTQNAKLNELYRQYILGNTSGIKPEDMNTVNSMLESQNLKNGFNTYGATRGDAYQNFLQAGRTDLNAENVVNAQDLAKSQALAQLSNGTSLYNKVGDQGPAASIKGQDLYNASAKARQDLLKNLGSMNGTAAVGAMTNGGYANVAGLGHVRAVNLDQTQGLGNLLTAAEGSTSGQNLGRITGFEARDAKSDLGQNAYQEFAGLGPDTTVQGFTPGSLAGTQSNMRTINTNPGNYSLTNGQLQSTDEIGSINSPAKEAALSNYQNYFNRLLGGLGYFDTLGSQKQSGTVFGQDNNTVKQSDIDALLKGANNG